MPTISWIITLMAETVMFIKCEAFDKLEKYDDRKSIVFFRIFETCLLHFISLKICNYT